MADPTTVKLISDLPPGPSELVGTELVEIQAGTGAGASQQSTAAKVADIALRQSVQTIVAGTGGVVVDASDVNNPKVSVPVPVAGNNLTIDNTNPEAPIYTSTTPVAGGINASYGSVGGAELKSGDGITGISTAAYQLTGWSIQCDPSGSVVVDVKVGTLGSATSTIVGAGNFPTIAGSTYNSSINLSTWDSVNIPRGALVEIVIKSASTATWFNLALFGKRV
jgi:hypothetical protein